MGGAFVAGVAVLALAACELQATPPGVVPESSPAPCPGGAELCGDLCTWTASDSQHCGSCDTACRVDEACSQGACVTRCPASTTRCAGACVVTATDPLNCGSCESPCAAGEVCRGGSCTRERWWSEERANGRAPSGPAACR